MSRFSSFFSFFFSNKRKISLQNDDEVDEVDENKSTKKQCIRNIDESKLSSNATSVYAEEKWNQFSDRFNMKDNKNKTNLDKSDSSGSFTDNIYVIDASNINQRNTIRSSHFNGNHTRVCLNKILSDMKSLRLNTDNPMYHFFSQIFSYNMWYIFSFKGNIKRKTLEQIRTYPFINKLLFAYQNMLSSITTNTNTIHPWLLKHSRSRNILYIFKNYSDSIEPLCFLSVLHIKKLLKEEEITEEYINDEQRKEIKNYIKYILVEKITFSSNIQSLYDWYLNTHG